MKNVKTFESVTGEFELNIREILEGIKSGKLKYDLKGHNSVAGMGEINTIKFNNNWDAYIMDYCDTSLIQLDSMDKFYKTLPKKSQEIHNMMTYRKVKVGEMLHMTDNKLYCWDCGSYVTPILISKNKVAFIYSMDYYEMKKSRGNKDFILKESDIPECKISKLSITDHIKTQINLPSGKLIIANRFRDSGGSAVKEIDTMSNEYSKENSINHLGGRINLAKHLETKDIGIGQMGNMSMGVFKNDKGNEILFASDYDYNTDVDIERKGYIKIGEISNDVWRWMCGDVEILKKYNVELPDLKEGEKDSNEVVLDVKPGNWTIEHYYDLDSDRKDGIYSRLYLTKKGLFEK